MRHAGAACLDSIEPLLASLRAVEGLKEKKRGVFYAGGRACLHFHEDPAGIFADLRLGPGDWERFPVASPAEQQALLARLQTPIASETAPTGR
jgi:hypothetical protein